MVPEREKKEGKGVQHTVSRELESKQRTGEGRNHEMWLAEPCMRNIVHMASNWRANSIMHSRKL